VKLTTHLRLGRGQENVDLYIHSPIRLHLLIYVGDNFFMTVQGSSLYWEFGLTLVYITDVPVYLK
jgi:hypothetical protein